MFRVFRETPHCKVVYIAPLKALVRERMDDWKVRIEDRLGKRVVELTGDVTPDAQVIYPSILHCLERHVSSQAIERADLIVTTPEKWDGISRSWQSRKYVKVGGRKVVGSCLTQHSVGRTYHH